jgi:hypothetical protein
LFLALKPLPSFEPFPFHKTAKYGRLVDPNPRSKHGPGARESTGTCPIRHMPKILRMLLQHGAGWRIPAHTAAYSHRGIKCFVFRKCEEDATSREAQLAIYRILINPALINLHTGAQYQQPGVVPVNASRQYTSSSTVATAWRSSIFTRR